MGAEDNAEEVGDGEEEDWGEDWEEEWEEEDEELQVVGENICLLLDDSGDEKEKQKEKAALDAKQKKKKEKKVAKEEKKRQKIVEEGKRRRAARLQKKAVMDAKIAKEAKQEARLIAEEAARRQARRLEAYDKGVTNWTKGLTQTGSANISKVVEDAKRAAVEEAKNARRAKRQREEEERKEEEARAAAEAAKAAASSSEDSSDEKLEKMDSSLVNQDTDAAAALDSTEQATDAPAEPQSMASAIADAKTADAGKDELPVFASFAKFNAQAAHQKAHGDLARDAASSSENDSEDEQVGRPMLPRELYSFTGALPPELPQESAAEAEPGLYVAHFIRYVVGAWQKSLTNNEEFEGANLTFQTKEILKDEAKLQETVAALKPLLQKLRSRDMNPQTLKLLCAVVTLAIDRNYTECNVQYVNITMGKKLWHNAVMQTMMQQNHGGGIRKIMHSSPLNDFDFDTTQQAYMWSFKRLLQFLQYVRPSSDPTKNLG